MTKPKKFLCLLMAILMCLSIMPATNLTIEASATSKSRDDAINWVKSKVGQSIDTDGFPAGQPYQCVDLIKAYYSYLGVNPVSGNGSDYTSNALPSGWQRLQGVQPQKGDILVYTGGYNNYGHVGIYESDYSHYHQNFDNNYKVLNVSYKYNSFTTPYWGVIRPNWSTPSAPPAIFTGLWHEGETQTNACIIATINYTYVQKAGCYYGTSTSNMTRIIEDVYNGITRIWYDFNDNGVTLAPGTTYYYKIFVIIDGVEYQSTILDFKTQGHSHNYSSKITKQPTCTSTGVKTFTCSCGATYTETISKTAHNSDIVIPAVAATCTQEGLTQGKKCSVCGTVTVAQQKTAKKAHTEVIDKAVAATCTQTGLTQGKHCSSCGLVIVKQNVVDKISHCDNDFNGKCDNCGVSSSAPSAPTVKCGCSCHKGGIAGLIFRIINFFQKLFGMNTVCACGAAH